MGKRPTRKKFRRPPLPSRELIRFKALALIAAMLAIVVVSLGAYTRLSDAGLGCPDWPGCYGQLVVPGSTENATEPDSAWPDRPLEHGKAWKEMIHRYAAATLGLLVLALAVMAFQNRRDQRQPVFLPLLLVPLVVLQALLGKLTVTELLHPTIVVAHLLGGMTTLGALWWLAMTPASGTTTVNDRLLARLALGALLVLTLQIGLGGWTSSNYAAMACPDFPTCQHSWWPDADFVEGFDFTHDIDDHDASDFEGGVLGHPARVAIHLAHRLGAAVVLTMHMLLGALLFSRSGDRAISQSGIVLIVLTAIQVGVGISIVRLGLPLALATFHNLMAALLLLSLLTINRLLRLK